MGRPPQPVGTYGRIHFVDQPSGEVQARTRFRDYDGRVRMVTKVGRSRASAERALKAELRNRHAVGGEGAMAAATRMTVLVDAWFETNHGWSTGTQRTYRSVITKQVKPAFGQLCIREVTPGVVSRALSVIAKGSGPGAAKDGAGLLVGHVRAGDAGRRHRDESGP